MRQVTHALLTRPPLSFKTSIRRLPLWNSVRLACVRHAASVHPEPGSNSQFWVFVFVRITLTLPLLVSSTVIPFTVNKDKTNQRFVWTISCEIVFSFSSRSRSNLQISLLQISVSVLAVPIQTLRWIFIRIFKVVSLFDYQGAFSSLRGKKSNRLMCYRFSRSARL